VAGKIGGNKTAGAAINRVVSLGENSGLEGDGLIAEFYDEAHFLGFALLDAVVGGGKRRVGAHINNNDYARAAFRKSFGIFIMIAANRAVVAIRAPVFQKIFERISGRRLPDFVRLFHLSGDDGI
jgi:hypothetical protein